jgi:hypothetical protein
MFNNLKLLNSSRLFYPLPRSKTQRYDCLSKTPSVYPRNSTKSPAKNVKDARARIRNRTVKGLCPGRLALGAVVLAKVPVESAGLCPELGGDVGADDRDASDDEEKREGPGTC